MVVGESVKDRVAQDLRSSGFAMSQWNITPVEVTHLDSLRA